MALTSPSDPPCTLPLAQILTQVTGAGDVLASWQGADPCVGTWLGISCISGQVTGLDLSYKGGLSGSLPDALKWVVNLTSVTLPGTGFSGGLPASWSSLTAVTQLNLMSNALTGTLPAAWSTLTKLTWLNLAYNQLTATLPAAWATAGGMQVKGSTLVVSDLLFLSISSNLVVG